MSKPKNHIPGLGERLAKYAEGGMFDFSQFSPYHMRITDGGYTIVDFWSTGRYYIVTTDYLALAGGGAERAGEKGQIPIEKLEGFLDAIFYAGGLV